MLAIAIHSNSYGYRAVIGELVLGLKDRPQYHDVGQCWDVRGAFIRALIGFYLKYLYVSAGKYLCREKVNMLYVQLSISYLIAYFEKCNILLSILKQVSLKPIDSCINFDGFSFNSPA